MRRDVSQCAGEIFSAISLVCWIDGRQHQKWRVTRQETTLRLLQVARFTVNIIRTEYDEIARDLIAGAGDCMSQAQLTFLKSKINLDAKVAGKHKVAHHLDPIARDHNYI